MDMVSRNGHVIDSEKRNLISSRYKRMTAAVNREFWGTSSDTANSLYVGSYGRGTAISDSDLDILVSLPRSEYERFDAYRGNGQSRLLQALEDSIESTWSTSNIHADGQVVVVKFSDGMRFEILPAFKDAYSWTNSDTYTYADTNSGGRWLSTNPKSEQEAMREKDTRSNGLLFDTCKHIRYVHTQHFSSYHLSGILIDSFVYAAIGGWHWVNPAEGSRQEKSYESCLLDYFDANCKYNFLALKAPGSGQTVEIGNDGDCLRKVLNWMAS